MFARFAQGWVPCEVVRAAGGKVEVVVNGVRWVMFAENVRAEAVAA